MTTPLIRISGETQADDRFDRFRQISWWDQERLSRARIVVIGAGALGNELIKNLALLGIGSLLIVDLDTIENSNLSRSVLYRASHNGRPKAEVAAAAARAIYPEICVHFIQGNVIHDLGLGIFRWADLVLGGLDNREARLAINRACRKVGRPWIDGAIEQIQGWARFFAADGPCYECTMSERDWKILQQRRSCNLLTREQMEGGKIPTTPTISSIIAGVQCQEAVKYLHGLPTMAGRGWVFEGVSGDSYGIEFQQKSDCQSHDPPIEVIPLEARASELTVRELLNVAREHLGREATLEFFRDLAEKLVCPACGEEEPCFDSLSRISASKALCPACQAAHRELVTYYRIHGQESFLDRPLVQIGVPPFEIILGRSDDRTVGFELAADSRSVLGELAGNEEDVRWN